MNVISLFSGCGGLDLGFERAGPDIPVANEYDPTIFETFKVNHPRTHLIEGDIRKVTKKDIAQFLSGDVDGIIGGPPCQSWSEAGALREIEDARGQLFFDYIRILKEFRPRFFLAEEAGYDVSLTMVNAKNYGVAEKRKRVFYIGFRNDLHIDFVFPKGSTEDDEKKLTLRNIIWDLQETAVPAGPKNYHNPEAINNNEYFTGAYSPIFMCPRSMSRPTRQRSFLQSTSSARRPVRAYYTWSEKGRPVIDESLYTGKYNPDIPNFIQANEACKLLEEGVCSLEECDTAMELGYNMEGPIHYIQRFEPQQIADALNAVADHFGKEIFRPVATITTGAYKRG